MQASTPNPTTPLPAPPHPHLSPPCCTQLHPALGNVQPLSILSTHRIQKQGLSQQSLSCKPLNPAPFTPPPLPAPPLPLPVVLIPCACFHMQDAKAGTIPAEPLMQALLEQYLKRVSVNRTTLMALFAAGDTNTDGLLSRPQAKAALLCAQPSITDTVLTTIWLEREKVWFPPWPAPPPWDSVYPPLWDSVTPPSPLGPLPSSRQCSPAVCSAVCG